MVACAILYGKKLTRCLCSLMFEANNQKVYHKRFKVFRWMIKMHKNMGYKIQS